MHNIESIRENSEQQPEKYKVYGKKEISIRFKINQRGVHSTQQRLSGSRHKEQQEIEDKHFPGPKKE